MEKWHLLWWDPQPRTVSEQGRASQACGDKDASHTRLVVIAGLSCWCHSSTWASPGDSEESQVRGRKEASGAGLLVVVGVGGPSCWCCLAILANPLGEGHGGALQEGGKERMAPDSSL